MDEGAKTRHRIMRVGMSVSKKPFAINDEMEQKKWVIHLSVENNTVECKTQRDTIILCPTPSFMKCMRTNDRILRYKRLPSNVFCDTLISETASTRVNKYAEVYAKYFGWAQDCSTKTKGDDHEALSLLF